ncbi:hypothetical protein N7472_002187 [Penicillium cf. griseofulvum]|uniref:Uncharacterized protein n=1 Tax=Penicillium cf. griseofulvum TaxID=2972120 RepID=A0A9W9MQQ8_9EURO|nr:hypothetical protein N7472_002187 [Penicillium cf. griseofulvum]KAJ5449278.1 hypothetical protein N7445_004099 [Penicillium cf. griseofulvum]
MSDRTAANSTNDQGAPGDRNGARQTKSAGRENAREDTNGSPERRQIRQQEIDLNYYRKFLKDLVGVIRDSHSESVARIVSLIRSGASNEEIHIALQRVREES